MGLMLCGGGLLGLLYDVCRVFAKEFRFARFQTLIVDLCYWLAAAVIVFKLLYTGNHGDLRIYVFIGLLVGGWLYFVLLSRIAAKVTRAAIQFGKKLYYFILKAFYVLLIKPVILLYKLIKILLGFLLAITIFFYKFMIQLLYPFQKLFLWLLRITRLQLLYTRSVQIFQKWKKRFKK